MCSDDPRWSSLLVAARVWRANLIPNTSTGLWGPTAELIKAVEAFDNETPDQEEDNADSEPAHREGA